MTVIDPEPEVGCVPWEIDPSCCDGWDDFEPAVQLRSTAMAWETLRTLTAGRVGNCSVVMRPCLQSACNACAGDWLRPIIRNGNWYNVVCGGPRCSCERLCEISFPGPVAMVDSVVVDGAELDASQWRVDNGSLLVRTDGECWPSCQHMERPLTAVGTMGITYVPGINPGVSGRWAAGLLACEFAKACSGKKCALPSGVTTVVRQGVAMVMDPQLFPGGLTTIREVDVFVGNVNPNRLKSPSLVWSPDLAASGHRYETPR